MIAVLVVWGWGWALAAGLPEADLGRLHLEPAQEGRLGITVAPVLVSDVVERTTWRGVLVAPGALTISPLTGPDGLQRSAEAEIAAAQAVGLAQADREVAGQELERAKALRSVEAGSVRRFEEASAAVARADANLRAARRRQALASGLRADRRDDLWVQVALPVGELSRVDPGAPAGLRLLGAPRGEPLEGAPVVGPAGADPGRGTVDLYYAAPVPQGRVGQVVAVTLPGPQTAAGAQVPAAALLLDSHGGSWVYLREAPGQYRRVRVSVRDVIDGAGIIDEGLPSGAEVVVDGAAELFGFELGNGK